MQPAGAVEVRVDGVAVTVDSGASLLEACDAAGRYVPRLCYYPGLDRPAAAGLSECGLCVVRLGDGSTTLACITGVGAGVEVFTDDPGLHALRRDRLTSLLSRHPHICLSCPDRDGCSRDECTYGNPPEARCCDEFGRCELGKLVAYVDRALEVPRGAVAALRTGLIEGRIRRETALCVGCGRCVRACSTAPEAGRALELVPTGARGATDGNTAPGTAARPKQGSLRASGCTFCGLCVMVCPAGALTAPGEAGVRWVAGRRKRFGPGVPVLPPDLRCALSPGSVAGTPPEAGVFTLFDMDGQVLRIGGVADLRRGLADALTDPACAGAVSFQVELDALFTQRESELLARYAQAQGHLPPGNDLGGDLFADETAW